ncbi:hypothetical protein AB6D66_24600 [Vibrio pomeroyi]|uniref:Uncharacterized protein n=1 Tax=Vibrio pomeroyi TaxID=198832 RepID=A0ABV4N431_9VIBR|nr:MULTISPECIES: hypothetical protein [unclassified Vibrio]UPR55395.1 hypothetical protein ITG10_09220 [Vibrio sp. ED004]
MSRFKEVFGLFYSGLLFVAAMKSVDEIVMLLVEVVKNQGIEQKDMYLRIGMKLQYLRMEVGSGAKLSVMKRWEINKARY